MPHNLSSCTPTQKELWGPCAHFLKPAALSGSNRRPSISSFAMTVHISSISFFSVSRSLWTSCQQPKESREHPVNPFTPCLLPGKQKTTSYTHHHLLPPKDQVSSGASLQTQQTTPRSHAPDRHTFNRGSACQAGNPMAFPSSIFRIVQPLQLMCHFLKKPYVHYQSPPPISFPPRLPATQA